MTRALSIRTSIILPNRNHARELETSLAAILGQSRPFDEIIVIDDDSTDNSRKVIGRFAEQREIVFLQNERRLGVAGAVNRGLAAATGSHIVFASADEKIMPTMNEALTAAISSFPELKVAVSKYTEWDTDTGEVFIPDETSPLGTWYVRGTDPQFFSPDELRTLLRRQFVWLSVNTAIFERDALESVGGFDPALRWHSDWFAMYAIAFRHGFCALPQSLAWFSRSPHSYSGRGMQDRIAQRAVVFNIMDKLSRPEFASMRAGIWNSPGALSPFMNRLLIDLPRRPRYWAWWARITAWWLSEVARGRRPGVGRRLLGRLRSILQETRS